MQRQQQWPWQRKKNRARRNGGRGDSATFEEGVAADAAGVAGAEIDDGPAAVLTSGARLEKSAFLFSLLYLRSHLVDAVVLRESESDPQCAPKQIVELVDRALRAQEVSILACTREMHKHKMEARAATETATAAQHIAQRRLHTTTQHTTHSKTTRKQRTL